MPVREEDGEDSEVGRMSAAFLAQTEESTDPEEEASAFMLEHEDEGEDIAPWGPCCSIRPRYGGDKDYDFLRRDDVRSSKEERSALAFVRR